MDITERQRIRAIIQRLLRSEEGRILLDELEQIWDTDTLLGTTPQDTGYRCGKRDAYKELKMFAEEEL